MLHRGGYGIGGPFWTDFSVLEEEDSDGALAKSHDMIQGNSR